MPSNIVATKGGATANSFVDQDTADTYFDNMYGAEEWEELDDEVKQRLLLSATKIINRLPMEYEKLADTQALNFPVANTIDATEDGWTEVQEACLLQAWYLYQNVDAINEAIQGKISGLSAENIGKVSKSVVGYNPLMKYAPGVLKLLKDFITLEMTIGRA